VTSDQEFKWIQEDIDRTKKKIAENKISLNEKARRAEVEEDKTRKEKRSAERSKTKTSGETVYSVTLDNAAKPDLELKKDKKDEKKDDKAKPNPETKKSDDDDDLDDVEAPRIDPIRKETLNILADLIDLTKKGVPATASAQPSGAAQSRP